MQFPPLLTAMRSMDGFIEAQAIPLLCLLENTRKNAQWKSWRWPQSYHSRISTHSGHYWSLSANHPAKATLKPALQEYGAQIIIQRARGGQGAQIVDVNRSIHRCRGQIRQRRRDEQSRNISLMRAPMWKQWKEPITSYCSDLWPLECTCESWNSTLGSNYRELRWKCTRRPLKQRGCSHLPSGHPSKRWEDTPFPGYRAMSGSVLWILRACRDSRETEISYSRGWSCCRDPLLSSNRNSDRTPWCSHCSCELRWSPGNGN